MVAKTGIKVEKMGKIKDLKIQLDQNTPYFAGDLIVGQVTFNLIKCLSITRILLSFEGIGKCKNGAHCKENIHSCKITLFNSEQSHQIGFYKYPFNIQLPEKLPTSVKMDNASISYKILAKIKCKGSSNKSLKSRILITEVIDANICNTPSVTILRKTPSLFSNKQKLSSKELLVCLKRSVYCAEEQIVLNIQYKDRSPRYMGNIKAVLNRYVLFNPKENKYRFSVKKKIKEVSDSIPDKTTERSLLIPVPKSVMPSNCLANAVQVKYVLHVKIVGYPEHKIPVVIGTKAKTISTSYEEIFRSIDINEYPPGYGNTVMPTAPSYIDDSFDQFEQCDRPLSTMFLYPPEYVPQNEFNIPPSYNETVSVISSSSNENI
ncbi:arrestin domain-containing protein A isoform X1 [Hydra vulgaris]|uniref:arrestin domain-containing protein A isoform X1 n=1 Tax=Hydra vulgaris TaxID=6087 RepID=UPI001F5F502F|nr:arrestin domain-containing protein A isoform X1 [Hydra vulgaris]